MIGSQGSACTSYRNLFPVVNCFRVHHAKLRRYAAEPCDPCGGKAVITTVAEQELWTSANVHVDLT